MKYAAVYSVAFLMEEYMAYQTPAYQTPSPYGYTPMPKEDQKQALNYTPAFQTPSPYTYNAPKEVWNQYATGDGAGSVQGSSSSRDSGGSTYDKSGTASGYGYSTGEFENLARQAGFNATEDYAKALEGYKGDVSGAYNPIYKELDRQLGVLPSQRAEQERYLGELTGQQVASQQQQQAYNIAKLDKEKQSGLRSLSEDMRNLMQSTGQYIGALGAGSSSAAMEAGEAVTRQGQKARSGLLGSYAQAQADIENVVTQNIAKINEFKTQTLMQISQDFNSTLNELNRAMATAKSQEKNDLLKLKVSLQQDLTNRLRQLDDQIMDYSLQVEDWARQSANKLQSQDEVDWQTYAELKAQGWSDADARRIANIPEDAGYIGAPEEKEDYSYGITNDPLGNPYFYQRDQYGKPMGTAQRVPGVPGLGE